MLDLPSTLDHLDHLADQVRRVEGVFRSVSEAETFHSRLRSVRDLLEKKQTAEPTYADLAAAACPGLADESLRVSFARFQNLLTKVATASSHSFTLVKPAGRGRSPDEVLCHFQGTPLSRHGELKDLITSATPLRADAPLVRARVATFRSSDLEAALTVPLNPSADGREHLRFFVSYAHADAKQANKLLKPLITDLEISKTFQFDFWHDHHILPGERWHDEIQDALIDCDFGLAFVSRDYLSSRYINEHELPALVAGDKPLIPICLGLLDFDRQNLRGLQVQQIYRYESAPGESRCFGECRAPMTEKFIHDLAKKIEDSVNKAVTARKRALAMDAATDPAKLSALEAQFPQFHQAVLAILQPPSAAVTAPDDEPILDTQRSSHTSFPRADLLRRFASDMLPAEQATAVQAAIASMNLSQAQQVIARDSSDTDANQAILERERRDALTYLTQWFQNPDEAPFAAVLGEIGSGKTTMLQMLARALSTGATPDAPPVFFVDLKTYTGDQDTTLEHLLANELRLHDRSGRLTPADIISSVQTGGGLIIFDGLDEKIIPLTDGPRQRFITELFRVLPPDVMDRPASAGRGRIIISCRSHYFPSVLSLASGFTGRDRQQISTRDYSACIMLPWRTDQVSDYLRQTLGEEKVQSALDTIAAVHNLTELSRRPYLLSKIVPQIHRLELERAAGKQVNEASLYQGFVEEWLLRDEGKHVFTQEHKQLMMEHLAADLWRDNAREWPWKRVADWLDTFLYENPKISARYARGNIPADILNADFRTATFFLRPDAAKDTFRFAHTSLQEFFLACHLAKALDSAADAAEALDMPRPSNETLNFLGQLLALEPPASRARRLDVLGQIMGGDRLNAAALAFRYWLRAIQGGYPEPAPTKVRLAGLNMRRWEIKGHNSSKLLSLTRADLRGVVLRSCQVQDVDISEADLTDAHIESGRFVNVIADRACLERANLNSLQWRGGSFRDSQAVNAKVGCNWTNVDLTGTMLPDNWDTLGAACGTTIQCSRPTAHRGDVTPDPCEGMFAWLVYSRFSPDGKHLLCGSRRGVVSVWEVATARKLYSIRAHVSELHFCAWSQDGLKFLSAASDGTIKVWDASSGRCLHKLVHHSDRVCTVKWNSTNTEITSASNDGTLNVWDAVTGDCLHTHHLRYAPMLGCDWRPDGQQLATPCTDSTAKIMDATTGRLILSCEGHSGPVTSCRWNPDGTRLLSTAEDCTIKIWDPVTGTCKQTLTGHSASVGAAVWSPDSQKILSTFDNLTGKIWDVATGERIHAIPNRQQSPSVCDWSNDGSKLLLCAQWEEIKVFDSTSFKRLWTGHELDDGQWVSTSGTGDILACSPDAWPYIGWKWKDPRTGHERFLPAEHFGPLPIYPPPVG